MKNDILRYLNDAQQLERLYREDKAVFKNEFNALYESIREQPSAQFWHQRLNYEAVKARTSDPSEVSFIILIALTAGVIAKLPVWPGINEEFFYSRNLGFIEFPLLIVYFARKHALPSRQLIFIALILLAALVFINLLPDNDQSNTLILSCIHLPLVLWSLLGVAFMGGRYNDLSQRITFLRYNGDLLVISAVIAAAGMLLTGVTMGLFSLIHVNIEKFYFNYVVVFGLAAIPIVGTAVTRANPQLVSRVSPLIAKLFSPLVLITLVAYLIAMVVAGKDPYRDREFLIIFNSLLIGVMAIILFSITGTGKSRASLIVLFLLALVTVVVNAVALSAIAFRIAEWGFTPNRTAVLGGNLLMLIHLVMVTRQLFRSLRQSDKVESVERAIAVFLPAYFAWSAAVTFLFPFIFGFR